MLTELVVRDLGVIRELDLLLRPGMTALTGETGAGKTMLVSAIELLVGGRADGTIVRTGAGEARVDGRFLRPDGSEVVLGRAAPAGGRSRAYVDGRPVPVGELAAVGATLVDLHGQHGHQSLLAGPAQRAALDTFGRVDRTGLERAVRALAAIDAELQQLGGDERARAREIDLLRFQVEELDAASLDDPDEEARLAAEEQLLVDVAAARVAGTLAHDALVEEGGAADQAAAAAAALARRPAFAELEQRVRGLAEELRDAGEQARRITEGIVDDPARLEELTSRRAALRELRRKYGERLGDVIAYAAEARDRLALLEGHDARAADLDRRRVAAEAAVAEARAAVRAQREAVAPALAASVETHLRELAMPKATVEVSVRGPAGEHVTFLLAANPGEPAMPLAKVASGGELARAMLALRMALLEAGGAPLDDRVLVFDEVDAGIGGEAALAVGRALGSLASSAQVLVVTHLPQVAAFADHQVAVSKDEVEGRTVATARALDDGGRVVELSRMLSGSPDSEVARDHAEELLSAAADLRGGARAARP